VAGYTSGDVHTMSQRLSRVSPCKRYLILVYLSIMLAIGSGKIAQLVKQATIGAVSWPPENYAKLSNLHLLGREAKEIRGG